MTSEQDSVFKKKYKPGRKSNDVWEYFIKVSLKSSPGHFSAECKFCNKKWNQSLVHVLQFHLANECNSCPEIIQTYYLGFITAKDTSTSEKTTSNKKQKPETQLGIDDFYENRNLPESKINAINKALIKAFVCCGISFAIIDNPFFRELLYQLRPNYNPPSRKLLAGRLLDQETTRVNQEINKELENAENLTLGKLFY